MTHLNSYEQAKLAIDFIHVNAAKPEKVNMVGLLTVGVTVKIVDKNVEPLQLKFKDPQSKQPPQFMNFEVCVLQDFAQRQQRKVEERQMEKYAPVYEAFGILCRDYQLFGTVGTEACRPERKEFVEKLKQINQMAPALLALALKAQISGSLRALAQTLQNGEHGSLVVIVQRALPDKVALDQGHVVPNHHEWEKTTASAHQQQFIEALMEQIEAGLGTRQKL